MAPERGRLARLFERASSWIDRCGRDGRAPAPLALLSVTTRDVRVRCSHRSHGRSRRLLPCERVKQRTRTSRVVTDSNARGAGARPSRPHLSIHELARLENAGETPALRRHRHKRRRVTFNDELCSSIRHALQREHWLIEYPHRIRREIRIQRMLIGGDLDARSYHGFAVGNPRRSSGRLPCPRRGPARCRL